MTKQPVDAKEKGKTIKLFWLPITDSKPFWMLGTILISVWILTAFIMSKLGCSLSERGQIGDMFGVYTSLMSGLTLAGLIYTILLQRQQMNQQREELSLTRETLEIAKEDLAATKKELTDSNLHFAAQNKTLNVQQFESTFFGLLNTLQTIITSYSGRNTFQSLYNRLSNSDARNLTIERLQQVLKLEYEQTFSSNKPFFIHYLEIIQTLFHYISTSPLIEGEQRGLFETILLSSIGHNERKLIFYFAVFAPDEEQLKHKLQGIDNRLNHLFTSNQGFQIHESHKEFINWRG